MGQQQSRTHSLIDDRNWQVIQPDSNSLFPCINPYAKRILHNLITNQYVEEYQLQFTSELDYQSYARQLELRKESQSRKYSIFGVNDKSQSISNSPYVYKVRELIDISDEDLCSSMHKALLYIEKVDLRLYQINDIPFDDQLYLTQATLEGFRILYEKVGYFDIRQEMIFINYQGKIKVWLNPNLTKNLPFYDPKNNDSQQIHGSQSQMIVMLLNIIQKNTDLQNDDQLHFKQYLLNKGIFDRLSFYKAIEQFKVYCQQNRLTVNSYMKSIYKLFHQDQSHFETSRVDQSEVVRVSTNRQYSHYGEAKDRKQKSNKKQYMDNHNVIHQRDSRLYGSHSSYRSGYTQGTHKSYQHNNRKNVVQPVRINQSSNVIDNNLTLYIPPLPINGSKNKRRCIQTPIFNQGELTFHNPHLNGSHMVNNQPEKSKTPFVIRNQIKQNKPIFFEAVKPDTKVKFNYDSRSIPQVQLIGNRPKQNYIYPRLNSANIIQPEANFTAKQIYKTNPIVYHSPHQIYSLDNQIAEDLQKFLGFNSKNF